MIYRLIRQLLFLFPPENVHYFSMNLLRLGCKIAFIKNLVTRCFTPNAKGIQKNLFGLKFSNPIGLGAGFDKNALYLNELEALGFGFVEIGTVTPLAQPGNDKPRLFRLPKDKALVNRMGFNNDGVEIIAERLAVWKKSAQGSSLIIGGNIGKNKNTPNEDAWNDYEICFNKLFDHVDYFVVNVSSPNTPGLRALQEKSSLLKILSHLQALNQAHEKPKPLLLKIAPDLTEEQLDDIVELSLQVKLDGLVATNTTISRQGLHISAEQVNSIGAGGLSGKPLLQSSTQVVKYLSQKTAGRIPIIASGGVFNGHDAKEKFLAGASLVQVWTGFIYEGPAIVKKIAESLEQTPL